MKKIFVSALCLSAIFMFTSCSDKKNQETIDYYLSQPRDSDLLGWWKYDTEENGSVFWYFKEAGTIATLTCDGEGEYYSEIRYYWYTEKKNGRKIMYLFRPIGRLYGSDDSRDYYEIRNDSLWMSSGIEGDKFYREELLAFVKKTIAPEGYENR